MSRSNRGKLKQFEIRFAPESSAAVPKCFKTKEFLTLQAEWEAKLRGKTKRNKPNSNEKQILEFAPINEHVILDNIYQSYSTGDDGHGEEFSTPERAVCSKDIILDPLVITRIERFTQEKISKGEIDQLMSGATVIVPLKKDYKQIKVRAINIPDWTEEEKAADDFGGSTLIPKNSLKEYLETLNNSLFAEYPLLIPTQWEEICSIVQKDGEPFLRFQCETVNLSAVEITTPSAPRSEDEFGTLSNRYPTESIELLASSNMNDWFKYFDVNPLPTQLIVLYMPQAYQLMETMASDGLIKNKRLERTFQLLSEGLNYKEASVIMTKETGYFPCSAETLRTLVKNKFLAMGYKLIGHNSNGGSNCRTEASR